MDPTIKQTIDHKVMRALGISSDTQYELIHNLLSLRHDSEIIKSVELHPDYTRIEIILSVVRPFEDMREFTNYLTAKGLPTGELTGPRKNSGEYTLHSGRISATFLEPDRSVQAMWKESLQHEIDMSESSMRKCRSSRY